MATSPPDRLRRPHAPRSESGLLVVSYGDGDAAGPWSDRKPDPIVRKRVRFGFSAGGAADSEQIILAR